MPGYAGQLYAVLGNRNKLGAEILAKQIQLYGLDKSPLVQFVDYVKALLTFNFGYSYASNQPVATEIISSGRLVNTLLLLGTSTVLGIVIGILLGIVVSKRRGSFLDNFCVTTSLTTLLRPLFFISISLIFILC